MIDQDHHYVPIFYLKQWAEADGKVPYFWLKNGRVIQSRIAPKSRAFETNLYARDNVDIAERHVVESGFFQRLDSEAALIHQRLMKMERFVFTAEERMTWAMFLAAANARTPDMVQFIKADASRTLTEKLEANPEELERALGHKPTMTLLEFAQSRSPGLVENYGLHVLLKFLTNPDHIQPFMDLEWSAHSIPNAKAEFLTCDRPLWYFENPKHEKFAMVMPLSARTLFVASRTSALGKALTKERDSVVAERVNTSMINRALERVYGRAKPAFVERIFKAKERNKFTG